MDLLNNIIRLNQVGMANFNTSGMGRDSFNSSLLVSAFPVRAYICCAEEWWTMGKIHKFQDKTKLDA